MFNFEFLNEKAQLWPIALCRMVIGVLWLYSLRWKLPPDFVPAEGRGLLDWLMLEVEFAAFPLYGAFVSDIVIPNFLLFAWLIFLSELFVGISLLTGTFTRVGGTIGMLMALNLGIGLLDVPGEWPWSYVMLAMWHGLFVVSAAGRVLGVDRWLWQKRPIFAWLA